MRHVTGDRVVNAVAIPPPDAQDERELGRIIDRLGRTRRTLATRLQSLLWTLGIDAGYHTGIQSEFAEMRTGDGRPLGGTVRLELDCLCNQLECLDRDLHRLESERVRQVQKPVTPTQKQAHDLEKLVGIGPIGAWTLAHEVFGWRHFKNDKALGSFLGLAPTPWCSGQMQQEQGISKAGPSRLRSLMVQLAWAWLRLQPESHLAKWYQERFGATAKRSRRVGIVAVTRKLLVALWRYVTQGIVPMGAALKPEQTRSIHVPCQKGFSRRRLAPQTLAAAA